MSQSDLPLIKIAAFDWMKFRTWYPNFVGLTEYISESKEAKFK